ncbi:WXG100 family type VII secretion target [Mycobacterium sp. 050128]|uniref:WXG100 family type VII secretion target n=1 Tax=Mycobacterium sp. 050128 TaxID=3096112 RepID=UPI002ED9B6CD
MDSMRYDHAMMADHVSAQGQLVAHMNDLRSRAMGVINQMAAVWTQHGSDAAQTCMHEIDQAFQAVFQTIERHGHAVGHASTNALGTDHAVQAGFRGL